MTETILLLAQTAAMVFLAAWMISAVKDNWLQPRLNAEIVGMILRIDRLEDLYPDQFQAVRHRRIENPRLHMAIFWLIVTWETLAAIAATIGAAAMALSVFGAAAPETARALALLGATWFTSVWAGMLIFGNHWVYWYCHEWGQNSHFQLLLWGVATMIFLSP